MRWVQGVLPFVSRAAALERRFKRAILGTSLVLVLGLVVGTPVGRTTYGSLSTGAREWLSRQYGLPPSDATVDALWAEKRARGVAAARSSMVHFFAHRQTSAATRALFEVAGLAPDNGLIRWGRGSFCFLMSSKVFDAKADGRSYALKPDLRAIWLRQVTITEGPFGLLQVPDTAEVRSAARAAGAIVDEGSAQRTNAWGCRGEEPDPEAPARGIVLGDSFMQGMFVGDDDTPSMNLQRDLARRWGMRTWVLNTGNVGYSPEQYYYALRHFYDRVKPHFVVMSVCPNDFGDDFEVLDGRGEDWELAGRWINESAQFCRSRQVPFLLVPVPCEPQFLGGRRDAFYPARISNLLKANARQYLDLLDDFLDEHLRLVEERKHQGHRSEFSPLFNGQIADNHFSPAGSRLWAERVGKRLERIVGRPK